MAILRCTKKLLDELQAKPVDVPESVGRLSNWHVNLLRLDRRKCVLFTNNATLYSFLVPGMKKAQFKSFEEVFNQQLFKSLVAEGLPQNQIEKVLDDCREIAIAKTNNRSVLGSMNDLAFQLKVRIEAAGGLGNIDLTELNHDINRIPMSAIEEFYSIDELRKLLTTLST
jgi:hypothetical protein